MAKSSFHARSNSFPSRPHPLILQCNEHLDRLRASQETSSSSLLSHKLGGLRDLHDCVENLIQLPLTQEAVLHEKNCVNELLDGSLRLLDMCTTAKDSLLHTKECTRELQSIMRRRKGGEVELRAEVKKLLASRKVVRKAISKALSNLKDTTTKDNQNVALVSLLQDMEVVTLSTFQELLQFISGTTQSKSRNWLLISKLMQTKKVACSQLADESEFAQLDEALQSCIFGQTSKFEDMNKLQNHLEKVELLIQDLEEGLEFVLRRLIKIRVALLNILNH
uniref:CM0216.180.nc protein n=1 Tax=Lotus japonicus TaxID=34305 RepID=B0BLH3_LOTJA|nr:CM0216.180.nc [Lotus japonicus]